MRKRAGNALASLLWPMLCTLASQPLWSQQPTAAAPQVPVVSVAPYDVASIRVNHSNRANQHITTGNGSLLAENATLRVLIRFAYDLPDKLLVGGPAWINDIHFDIRAKTDGVADIDQKKLSEEQLEAYLTQKQIPLQKLLEDRFHLKLIHEDRVLPFYALIATKSGVKIKRSDDKSDLQQAAKVGGGGLYNAPGFRVTGQGQIVAVKVTLDQLAQYLSNKAWGDTDRPVVNQTGLTGQYDFKFEWTPASSRDDTATAPALFTALQEQLGLKLDPQKGPVKVMVIDSAELPSEN